MAAMLRVHSHEVRYLGQSMRHLSSFIRQMSEAAAVPDMANSEGRFGDQQGPSTATLLLLLMTSTVGKMMAYWSNRPRYVGEGRMKDQG